MNSILKCIHQVLISLRLNTGHRLQPLLDMNLPLYSREKNRSFSAIKNAEIPQGNPHFILRNIFYLFLR